MTLLRPQGFCDNNQTMKDTEKESTNSSDDPSDSSDNDDLFVNTNRPQCTYESSETSEGDDDDDQ